MKITFFSNEFEMKLIVLKFSRTDKGNTVNRGKLTNRNSGVKSIPNMFLITFLWQFEEALRKYTQCLKTNKLGKVETLMILKPPVKSFNK